MLNILIKVDMLSNLKIQMANGESKKYFLTLKLLFSLEIKVTKKRQLNYK